MEKPIRR
ncbi:UNVERIFIED_CONTAM: hypothetical protein GTU68_016526 [Idotea baltica]|nr:hypothetical protein [Idotea baltica]